MARPIRCKTTVGYVTRDSGDWFGEVAVTSWRRHRSRDGKADRSSVDDGAGTTSRCTVDALATEDDFHATIPWANMVTANGSIASSLPSIQSISPREPRQPGLAVLLVAALMGLHSRPSATRRGAHSPVSARAMQSHAVNCMSCHDRMNFDATRIAAASEGVKCLKLAGNLVEIFGGHPRATAERILSHGAQACCSGCGPNNSDVVAPKANGVQRGPVWMRGLKRG
jgi:hypothetical protein